MARFIVVVLDGFGVGEMPDVAMVRPQDRGAHTAAKLLEHFPLKRLPTLESLGLMNLVPGTSNKMQPNPNANIGMAQLAHHGGDTFMGHQEIMGTCPEKPLKMPFQQAIEPIEEALTRAGFIHQRVWRDGLAALMVEEAAVIGDNLEADLGQVFNLCANFDQLSFDKVKQIGTVVRGANPVGRNIVFGGHIGGVEPILNALETRCDASGNSVFIGTNTPDTGVYENGFEVVHLGYGVDRLTQVPYLLNQQNVHTWLYGKVADIVQNPDGTSYCSLVDTNILFDLLTQDLAKHQHGFFCLNVQETDLSGHQQDPRQYWKVLERADARLAQVLEKMNQEDVLVVMADHGNDPFIGHTRHTREQVPLLVARHGLNGRRLGLRSTLSDVGASVADFFGAKLPQNGQSFLQQITP